MACTISSLEVSTSNHLDFVSSAVYLFLFLIKDKLMNDDHLAHLIHPSSSSLYVVAVDYHY